MDLKTFIEKGYFPKELPPPFTAKYFASFYDTNHALLPAVKDSSRGVIYSCPKLGLNRKTLTLTNPQHQTELFKYINANWPAILSFYKSATISYSNPTSSKGDRAANPKMYGDFVKDCFKKSYYHRYQLTTDISKYYPTAYTHSIPRALHGKEFSKKNKHLRIWETNLTDYYEIRNPRKLSDCQLVLILR